MARRNGDVPDLFEYAAEKAKGRSPGEESSRAEPESKAPVPPATESGRRAEPAPEPKSGPEPAVAVDEPAVAVDEPAVAVDEPEPAAKKPRPGSREAPVSVSQLVRKAGHAVEQAFGALWVEGEIASLSRPASGHLYFILKDDRAEVRAVMWRSEAQKLKFRVDQGMAARCRVRPTIYEQGGKFQLYVGAIEPAGLGADALALEQLKTKLAGEGLFALERKRKIPHLPRRIGIVTSKSGAAVRDIIRATQRRFPTPILIADAAVQGEMAAANMVRALRALSRCDVDVIILGRGGGSSSDLSAFNDEKLVRAVAACPIPVISAVGHEIDTSLTDLAADRRAATPTMAGEMAVPVLADLEDALLKVERRLRREIDVRIAGARQELDRELGSGQHTLLRRIHRQRNELGDLRRRLDAHHPRARLVANRNVVRELHDRADVAIRRRLDRGGGDVAELAGRLAALSPLRVLERGYALASVDGTVMTDADKIQIGARVDVRLARGTVHCIAESKTAADDPGANE